MRRVNYRRKIFIGIMVFVAVFSFVLLKRLDGGEVEVEAADLTKFDPGYIMSDYQMSNYNSMSESEIQDWLTAKNSCPNTDYDYYLRLSASTNMATWHFKDGHFVCLSEELFGDGEVIGSGETAAHIIWQASQDYQINPQVLIVLLQKENSLITDPIPNSFDYRTAAGYGCPDTAACSSKYYGFKNQVRNAAALFHEVLSGGWTNYPLGENYVRFSPNCSSGSVVNIRSLATSALYRYTPYQPNSSALSAGYGVVPGDACAAYGNRNFYSFFEDWFGGITSEKTSTSWEKMTNPRSMTSIVETMKINPFTKTAYVDGFVGVDELYNFASKMDIEWNGKMEVCLRTDEDTENNIDRCIIMSRMKDPTDSSYTIIPIDPIELTVINNTFKYELNTNRQVQIINIADYSKISFSAKVVINGTEYYQTTYDVVHHNNYFIPSEALSSQVSFERFLYPRNLVVNSNAQFIDLNSGETCLDVRVGYTKKFTTKSVYNDEAYFRTEEDSLNDTGCAIKASLTSDVGVWNIGTVSENMFVSFRYPRELRFKQTVYYVNIKDGTSCNSFVEAGSVVRFVTKIDIGGRTFFRNEDESSVDSFCVAESTLLSEL